MKRLLPIAAIILPLALHAGGEAALFRVLEPDARSASLSGALVAGEGLDAAGVNPAAAAWLEGPAFGASHASVVQDVFLESVACALPSGFGVFSAQGLLLHSPDLPALDSLGRQVGVLSSSEGAVGLGWSGAFGPVAGGLRLQWLERNFGQDHGSGQAADLGLQARLPAGFRLGLSVANLGLLSAVASDADPLLPELRGGAAWHVQRAGGDSLEALASVSRSGLGDLRGSVGLELGLGGIAFLRGGADLLRPESQAGLFSVGVGAHLGALALDAAWVPYGELGDGYRMSVTYVPAGHGGVPSGDPEAPWNLRLKEEDKGAWRLSWEAPTARVTSSFRLYSRDRTTGALRELSKKPVTGHSVRFKQMDPGATYYLSVSAVDSKGQEGPLSRELVYGPGTK